MALSTMCGRTAATGPITGGEKAANCIAGTVVKRCLQTLREREVAKQDISLMTWSWPGVFSRGAGQRRHRLAKPPSLSGT